RGAHRRSRCSWVSVSSVLQDSESSYEKRGRWPSRTSFRAKPTEGWGIRQIQFRRAACPPNSPVCRGESDEVELGLAYWSSGCIYLALSHAWSASGQI